MKKAISQLNISKAEKKKLESQVSELRKSSERSDVPFFGSQPISLLQNEPRSLIFPGSFPAAWSPGLIVGGSSAVVSSWMFPRSRQMTSVLCVVRQL
ncbi:MAG: hypothetical protein AABO57_15550 [Acidobacteriota bacterium]